MSAENCPEGLAVDVGDGHVFLDGACGVTATLTPDEALEASDRLADAAALAIGETKMPDYRPSTPAG